MGEAPHGLCRSGGSLDDDVTLVISRRQSCRFFCFPAHTVFATGRFSRYLCAAQHARTPSRMRTPKHTCMSRRFMLSQARAATLSGHGQLPVVFHPRGPGRRCPRTELVLRMSLGLLQDWWPVEQLLRRHVLPVLPRNHQPKRSRVGRGKGGFRDISERGASLSCICFILYYSKAFRVRNCALFISHTSACVHVCVSR